MFFKDVTNKKIIFFQLLLYVIGDIWNLYIDNIYEFSCKEKHSYLWKCFQWPVCLLWLPEGSAMLRGTQIERKFKNREVIHDFHRYYGQFVGSCSTGLQIICLAQRHKSVFQSQIRLYAWNSFWHTRCNKILFWLVAIEMKLTLYGFLLLWLCRMKKHVFPNFNNTKFKL
jgi:hypothetical protein